MSTRVSEETWEDLQAIAVREGRKVSDVARILIERALKADRAARAYAQSDA